LGIAAPWRDRPRLTAQEHKASVLNEIGRVAAFVEKELELQNRTSLGIDESNASFELPHIEDHDGPGRSVILAADPYRYVLERVPTSEYDRKVHYWLTDEEELALMDAIAGAEGDGNVNWPLLSQVGGARHEGGVITRGDVPNLAEEIVHFRAMSQDVKLREALDRVQSICRSAESYHLGIYIPGP
jgi:hypothetical protein